jgi:hypothetical protein
MRYATGINAETNPRASGEFRKRRSAARSGFRDGPRPSTSNLCRANDDRRGDSRKSTFGWYHQAILRTSHDFLIASRGTGPDRIG